MAIPSTATFIYRVISKPIFRGGLPNAKLLEVINAMKADTSGQFAFFYGAGNLLIFDWAPNITSNPTASIQLLRVIEWLGVSFSVLSITQVKGP